MTYTHGNKQASLSKINPTSEEFDRYYEKEDPWGIKDSPQEIARQAKLNYEFRNCIFNKGLDIGCGEGHLTASLKFVHNFEAIDISDVALKRAKQYYPTISFYKTDLSNLSSIQNNNYDFICCFETLYYISDDLEREKVLIDIKQKGKDNCVYCFSVVTIGENQYRRYFTYDEAVKLFSKHFNIIHHFPIALGNTKSNLLFRIFRKTLRIFSINSNKAKLYEKLLKNTKPEDANQCVFVLAKR